MQDGTSRPNRRQCSASSGMLRHESMGDPMNQDTVESPPLPEPVIALPWERNGDVNAFLRHEWLVTNGLGGYSSSTIMQIATRRYHGIFVPDLPSPRGRTMII